MRPFTTSLTVPSPPIATTASTPSSRRLRRGGSRARDARCRGITLEAGRGQSGPDAVPVAHRPAFPAAGLKRKTCRMRRILMPPTMRGGVTWPFSKSPSSARPSSGSARRRSRRTTSGGPVPGFFEDMMETMIEYHGTGLAAPQVSTGLRIVLYEVHGEKRGKDVLEIRPLSS